MFIEEAKWIAAAMGAIDPRELSPLLDIGSSTGEFRETVQPHIDACLFNALEERGVRVVHQDLKEAVGVDIVGDISDADVQQSVVAMGIGAVMCCNILEHVADREAVVDAISSVLAPGGYLFVSCPRSYPYHPDPIDTMYRPDLEALASAFPWAELVRGEVVSCRNRTSRFRTLVRLAVPFYRPRGWVRAWGNVGWSFSGFEATCVVLRKPL